MIIDKEDQAFARFLAIVTTNKVQLNEDFNETMGYTYSTLPLTSSATHRAVQGNENLGDNSYPQSPFSKRCYAVGQKDYSAYWLRLLGHRIHRIGR